MKTPPATILRHLEGGFTLPELLVAMAISAVVLSQLVVATYSLQRSFEAANYRMSAQEDQLRMIDYITRDLHMASAVTVQDGGAQVTITLPPTTSGVLDLDLGPLLTPAIASLGPPAAGSPTTVTYSAEGGQCVRQVGTTQTVVADTIADLAFARDSSFVTVNVTFTPEFSNSPTAATQPATRASSQVFLRNVASTQ